MTKHTKQLKSNYTYFIQNNLQEADNMPSLNMYITKHMIKHYMKKLDVYTKKYNYTRSNKQITKEIVTKILSENLKIGYLIFNKLYNKKRIEMILLSEWILKEKGKSFYIDDILDFNVYGCANYMYMPLQIEGNVLNNQIVHKKKIDTVKLLFICLYGKEYLNEFETLKTFKYSDKELNVCLEFWTELDQLINIKDSITVSEEPLPEFNFDL